MAATLELGVTRVSARTSWPEAAWRWSGIGLVSASWLSGAIFGFYILAFYVGAIPAQHLDQWNRSLPRLYVAGSLLPIAAIGAHFVTGGILLLLGPIQLIGAVRRRVPSLHRWLGRLYVAAAGLAGLGGLGFILSQGTIGGAPMNAGFGLYGALMTGVAVQTYRHARARRFDLHRAWAIRLFALTIGSWLYRMDYGFWMVIAHGAGHTHEFRGAFDVFMAFFFYLPNLMVAELFIRARPAPVRSALRALTAGSLTLATVFVGIGTFYFTQVYWGPSIVSGLLGRPG
jgi:hypothetical protein